MDSSNKFKEDRLTAVKERRQLIEYFLNPELANRGSPLRMSLNQAGKGLHIWLCNPQTPDKRLKLHFRKSDSELYLKMPSRHTVPEEFLSSENQSFFVLFESLNNRITGRFGQYAIPVSYLITKYHYKRGGLGNENRIFFPNYPLSEAKCFFLGRGRGLVDSKDFLDYLIEAYENLFHSMVI